MTKLTDYFHPDKVSWRIGSISKDGTKALALAYIDARDVMNRFDEVCTPDGWQDEYKLLGNTTVCRIYVKTQSNEWIYKEDGAGASDIEAEKGALSDAFKRAAVKWGVGRYLYDIKAPWVSIDSYKHILPSELERLAGLLPNVSPNQVKVTGVQGLSKEPAKFWSNKKLTLPFRNDFVAEAAKSKGVMTDAAYSWWVERFLEGLNKAPSVNHIERYEQDNRHILDALPAYRTQTIQEAIEIRISQMKGAA